MTYKTKKEPPSQPLRKTAYVSKALIAHKGLSNQAFRIACVMLAHKESCEPTIAEAAIMARVGRGGRRKAAKSLIEAGVCAHDGQIAYTYRNPREQYARMNPATIMRADVSDPALRVFAALSGFADRAGFAFPKYSTLSTKSTVPPRTLRRAMSLLDQLGLVSEQRRGRGSSWKFVNDPSLFTETDAPDLPEETCQEVLASALAVVGREPAPREGTICERKLKYAHRTLVARSMLFLDLRSSTERKNQKPAATDRAGACGTSSPAASGIQNSHSTVALRTSQVERSALHSGSAHLASDRGSLPWPTHSSARLVEPNRLQDPESEKTKQADPHPPFRGPPSPKESRFRRIGVVRNRMQRVVLQRTLRPYFSSWDSATFRAISVGALDPRRADSVREGFSLHVAQKLDWTESYTFVAGKTGSMKQRGHGLFKLGDLGGAGSPDAIQPKPEIMVDDQTDVMCLLNAELRRRFGDSVTAKLPARLTGRQRGQIKKSIQTCYSDEQIVKMIRVLVWDWEEIRTGFWPKQRLPMPNMNSLVTYADTLIQYVDTGVPSNDPARRGRSGYAERYLTPGGSSGASGAPPAAPRGFSLDDL